MYYLLIYYLELMFRYVLHTGGQVSEVASSTMRRLVFENGLLFYSSVYLYLIYSRVSVLVRFNNNRSDGKSANRYTVVIQENVPP